MNLSTQYLGLKLRTPLVPAASPLSENLDLVKRMQGAGASAVVFHSVFEEQLRFEANAFHTGAPHGSEAEATTLGYFPEPEDFTYTPTRYLENLEKARKALQIPIIASLNGTSFGGWTSIARSCERAGADALELNLYDVPADFAVSAADIEDNYLAILAAVRAQVKIPVAVKLSPYFTSLGHFATRLARHGANGLVLFNRFFQPDIELDTETIVPTVHLSREGDIRPALRWIALLRGRVPLDLAASGGIHRGVDALKLLMAGADITTLCSVLLRHGVERIRGIEVEMEEWMRDHGYTSVEQLKGKLSQQNCPNPTAFERAHYVKAIATDRFFERAG